MTRVLVLGAGVVGTSAAWFLARDGHEVTVVDRQPGPGLETSFANAAQISASHAEPWATPEVLRFAGKWMFRSDAPLLVRWWRLDPAMWRFCLRFLRNCAPARVARNTELMMRIALYSRAQLKALRGELGLSYDQRTDGILRIFRDREMFEVAAAHAEAHHRLGADEVAWDPEEILRREPSLAALRDELAGGLFSAADESGDAFIFTNELAKRAAGLGVTFRHGETITALERDGDRLAAVVTDKGRLTADVYVLSLGSYGPFLTRDVGFTLPIYPAKGYSVTVPVGNSAGAPSMSITDVDRRVAFSRLGGRLRAAGTAELVGWDRTLDPKRVKLVLDAARADFPEAGDYDKAEPWTGLRPKTPDSVPIIGWSPLKNLFLDTGHGYLGWTMGVGSGRLTADLIAGRTPEIDPTGFGLERF